MPISNPDERRRYQREWIAKRRADYLVDKSCVKCNSTEELEIDHIDPKLKISHNVWSWSLPRREAELAKCQVLCCSCHAEKTFSAYTKAHGATRYRLGCRCDICRTAATVDRRRYKR